jgi:phytoene/squalene synthetase
MLVSLNGELGCAGAAQLRFEAAALAGVFDIAAELVDEPRQWVTLLSRAAAGNPIAAAALHEEITRRFDGELDTDTAGELEAVAERLRDRERLSNSPA